MIQEGGADEGADALCSAAMGRDESDSAADVVIIGAGAAGLMAAIQAGRRASRAVTGRRILLLDSASRPGAKILVSGGGRCNVTHERVSEEDYSGSTAPAIRNVLRRFDVPETIRFFADIGVELKREETGKLFPVTDDASTVLDALLRAVSEAGVTLQGAHRVTSIRRLEEQADGARFLVASSHGEIRARTLILATGGKSLPRTGSDGHGFEMVKELGHSLTPRIFPALVPLTLSKGHWLCDLSGLAVEVALRVRSASGRLGEEFRGAMLCTHFGLSGPVVLDISRHFIEAQMETADQGLAAPSLMVNWLPGKTEAEVDENLIGLRSRPPLSYLRGSGLPERLARAICLHGAGLDPGAPGQSLARVQRKALVRAVVAMELPITGHREYTFAEATAGGVPLREIYLDRMESRVCPGLYLCGEVLDVDGRIGGFNFQWAWSSGYVAGVSVQ